MSLRTVIYSRFATRKIKASGVLLDRLDGHDVNRDLLYCKRLELSCDSKLGLAQFTHIEKSCFPFILIWVAKGNRAS